jgi:hypothetical protein
VRREVVVWCVPYRSGARGNHDSEGQERRRRGRTIEGGTRLTVRKRRRRAASDGGRDARKAGTDCGSRGAVGAAQVACGERGVRGVRGEVAGAAVESTTVKRDVEVEVEGKKPGSQCAERSALDETTGVGRVRGYGDDPTMDGEGRCDGLAADERRTADCISAVVRLRITKAAVRIAGGTAFDAAMASVAAVAACCARGRSRARR